MAKKLIKNYFFTPGVGLDNNAHPSAYSLFSRNKTFIQKEIVAFINREVLAADDRERDIGYAVDGVSFDMALGTNYNAIFLGISLLETNSIDGEVNKTVQRFIQRTGTRVAALPAVIADATATTRVGTYFDEVDNIFTNGPTAFSTHVFPEPTTATVSQIAVKDRLIANLANGFITAEINSWVATNYPSNTYDVAQRTQDMQYAIYSVCYNVLYGGNSAAYDNARFLATSDLVLGTDANYRAQTVAAYDRLATISNQIVQGITVSKTGSYAQSQDVSGNNASGADATAVENLLQIVESVAQTGIGALTSYTRTTPSVSWATADIQSAKSAVDSNKVAIVAAINGFKDYVYSQSKCERDSGYVLDAAMHDLRYGGNEQTHRIASKYWDGDVAQIDGTRVAEYETYYWVADLVNDYLLLNIVDITPEQDIEVQIIDETKTAEAGSFARVSELLGIISTVIENGLSSLPALDIQLGRVEVLGKVELEDMLLISNVTENIVLYNFSDPSKGGTVSFFEENSTNYPQALTVNNGFTLIRFKASSVGQLATDSIQIFLENTELKVRPYDFGTDALERMRVGLPQAMLDADFEYGLQPTKWQAIGMQRGYPATYEISATDVAVTSVITDGSTGTANIGASLITVTTTAAHGFTVSQPFSIRALAASITGFARAEGTFLIFDVPTPTTFRYYAKAKVGTNGQVLATTTTQLRAAGFYTGASVGTPTFSVASNGSSGTFTTAIQTTTAQNTINFVGTAPPIGAPLSGTGINPGTQITGVFGATNVDGTVATRYVKTTQGPDQTSIELTNVSGLAQGMALGNGAVPNLLREITAIDGDILSLSSTLALGYTGDENIYSGGATGIIGTGSSAVLDISTDAGAYTVDVIATAGTGYAVGDTLRILGDALGGTTPDNDFYGNVDTVDGAGGITAITVIPGTSGVGTATFTGVATGNSGSRGSGASWTVQRAAGVYTVTSYGPNPTSGYYVGNKFRIVGTNFEGSVTTNDCVIEILTSTNGNISDPVETAVSATGTATRGDQIPVYATVTISENTIAAVPAATTISYTAIATIQVDFATGHGFVPGMGLSIAITSSGTNHALASGPFAVEQIVSPTRIRYIARAAGTIDATPLAGTVYVRPDSFFTHRPFDGGVMLGTGGPQHGGQAIRQSKKYIRYQSGKGAMYNTGALFAPSFDLRSVTAAGTASGSLITVTTDDVDHGLQAGSIIKLSGIETTGYNGQYVVNEIVDERSYRVTSGTQLGSTTGVIGSQCQMALVNWHGATVRSGPFDDQNGIFFQYDGVTLSVGRRTSTFQIAGTIAVNANSNAITGTNTRFLDQLQEGDRIVIRGMTHVVATITSNSAMVVTPDFRGVNDVSGVKVCKVQDLIIPQSDWNLDTCDGNGPSGYNIDVTKMQMIGIQFSWYGAGFIDWMFRGSNGDYVFCHRLKGNNLNTEAYMRTGNLPVRYEVLNEGARTRLSGNLNSSATTIALDETEWFPESGVVYIDNEMISFSGKDDATNTLTGCTRAATLSNFAAGAVRSYTAGAAATHADNQGVVLISNTTSPIISHWGSAYLIDGRFDEDRGYIFGYTATGLSISTTKQTAFLIRLAPSVSNAVVGDLGEKELLNRAQLLLNAIAVTSETGSGGIVIEGVLNPQNYPANPSDIGWAGLNGASAGGQPSFAQIAPGGSVNWNGGATATTTAVTTQATMTGTITARTAANWFGSNQSIANGQNYFWITQADYNSYTAQGFTTGIGLSGTGVRAGTTITAITFYGNRSGTVYYYVTVSQSFSQNVTNDSSLTVSLAMRTSSTNQVFLQKTAYETSTARLGTEVSDALFPANTTINAFSLQNFFGTQYYRVSFTQTSSASTITPGTTTITFKFGQPAYALPGEQVFSFISNPGGSDTLELGSLKELTTTAIGGRGAFPNGPDVLAINVYKVSGAAVNANIILRWGEAQA